MKLRLTGTLVLVLGIAALASASAYAGNGHGNGNGNGNDNGNGGGPAAAGPATDHGNSANAPGQQKNAPADAPAPAVSTPSTTVAETTSTTAQEGVKPANDTAHDTHAAASSDETKLYGNGKTAGEIAMQNGAAGSTRLHGPGNSQPHKASPCSGGHEVDVHALKGKRRGSCGTTTDPAPNPTPDPGHGQDPGNDPGHGQDPGKGPSSNPSSNPSPNPANTPSSTPATNPTATGMLPGVVSAGGKSGDPKTPGKRHSGAVAGVLGLTQEAAVRGSLPFTGADLWSTVFVAIALILIGLALCQRARTLPVRESEEGARS